MRRFLLLLTILVPIGCGPHSAERDYENDVRDVIVASMVDANQSATHKPYVLERKFSDWSANSFDSFVDELEKSLHKSLSHSPEAELSKQEKLEAAAYKLESVRTLSTIEKIRQDERSGMRIAAPKVKQFNEISWPSHIKLEPSPKETVEQVMDKMLRNEIEPRVRFGIPVFSPSRRFAAVSAMEFPGPMRHMIGWEIILEYRGDGWVVLAKEFYYFV